MEACHSCPYCHKKVSVKEYYRHSVLEKLKHDISDYLDKDSDGSDVYNDHFTKVLEKLVQNFAVPVLMFPKKLS